MDDGYELRYDTCYVTYEGKLYQSVELGFKINGAFWLTQVRLKLLYPYSERMNDCSREVK